jgi:prevent-host-death family protein
MGYVSINEAKAKLASLVQAVESGVETEIVISRRGKPAARLVPLDRQGQTLKWGVAKGKIALPDDFDADDEEIVALFAGKTPL